MSELEKELKTSFIRYIMCKWENQSKYRWDDVIDYICEHWKLDEEWEEYFENSTQALFNKSFNSFVDAWLKAETNGHKEKEINQLSKEIEDIAVDIIKKLEEKLEKDLEKLI
jgi:hypothetical protein